MNVAELREKLMAAARANPPDEHVPYAFEQRIMARVSIPIPFDLWAGWSRALWRAVAPSVAIAVCVCAWAFLTDNNSATNHETLVADLENTVLSAVDHPGDAW